MRNFLERFDFDVLHTIVILGMFVLDGLVWLRWGYGTAGASLMPCYLFSSILVYVPCLIYSNLMYRLERSDDRNDDDAE